MKPGASLNTTTSLPMRRATSRQAATVSSEVCGVRASSMTFIFGTGLTNRLPMQRSREPSGGTVWRRRNAGAWAIPRPIVPAPITAMVFTSISGSPLDGTSLRKFPITLFVKTEQDLRAADDHGPADKIRLLGHELDG